MAAKHQSDPEVQAQPVVEMPEPEHGQPKRPADLLEEVISSGRFGVERERLRFEEERFTFQQRRARLYAKSGLFASQKDLSEDQAIAQAMVRIELGASMGFSEAESLQGIRVINGETAIAAALRAARMQAAGYTWVLEWYGTEAAPTGCRVWPSYKGRPIIGKDGAPVSVAFLEVDAKKMLTTVWENNVKKRTSILEKENWKMSPRNMYFARAITNTQRFYAPGVLSVNLPSIEEAMDFSEPAPKRERATLSIEAVKPSTDENRGHDATQPEPDPEPIPGVPEFASWDDVEQRHGGDSVAPELGLRIKVKGKEFLRDSTDQTWTDAKKKGDAR